MGVEPFTIHIIAVAEDVVVVAVFTNNCENVNDAFVLHVCLRYV